MFRISFFSILMIISSANVIAEEAPAEEATAETPSNETEQAPADEQAIEEEQEKVVPASISTFKGEGSLGLIVNSGNTNNESLNGSIKASYEVNKWLHDFVITAKRVKETDRTTAERYLFTEKSAYSFSERTYAFVSVRYDDDRFDGFEYQSSAATGIGWTLVDTATQHFNAEVGLGKRRNKLDTRDFTVDVNGFFVDQNGLIVAPNSLVIEETISRFSEHWDWQATETTTLTQDLLVESGDSNTTSELDLGLKVRINTSLALQVAYNVKHNSDPPVDTKDTDRTTSITLVFGF